VIWPLAALFGRRQQRPRSSVGWLGRLLALLAALVALVFVVGLVVVVGSAIFQNDLTVFFGVPRAAGWLFTLPIVSLVLAVGMLICAVLSWQGRFWGRLNRVYYLLLTLAAFGYVGLIGLWGALPL
jgi:archaellum biogenesis protein FlaJ (TadC family)